MGVRLLSGSQGRVPEISPVFHRITLNHTADAQSPFYFGALTFPGPSGIYFLYIPGLGILRVMPFRTLCSLAYCFGVPTCCPFYTYRAH